MPAIRVLIVDDHPVYAEGLRAIIEEESDLEVVALAHSGAEAVELLDTAEPDVITLDVRLPGMNGADTARAIRARRPYAQILVVSGFDDERVVADMVRAGATGYVLKDAGATEIVAAIRRVNDGESYLTPSVARKLIEQFSALATQPAQEDTDGLTPRELEVLRLVAAGMTNKEVAADLCLSERTVENHIHNIYQKLQIRDRTQAVLYAMRRGWVTLQEGA
ncbi:MAG: response regulator transcription factor [Chloroflexi bacterium]|nr:response regulator transcription factor [Chloroflexota bacterium]